MSTGLLFTFPRVAPLYQGAVQPGSKLYFYETGTSTPADTFTTKALSVANANPVVADSNGAFGEIWLTPSQSYRVTWKTSADVQLTQDDDVNAFIADLPRLSASNTFTGSTQRITATGVSNAQLRLAADSSIAWFGIADASGEIIAGSAAGDALIAGTSGIALSADQGVTLHLYITSGGALSVVDGITAPGTVSGRAQIYVDTADGDLKIKYGDGTVKTIVVDT